MDLKQVYPNIPIDAVVVEVPRTLIVVPYSDLRYEETTEEWDRCGVWSLVICKKGEVIKVRRTKSYSWIPCAGIYSLKSGVIYSWSEYYKGERNRATHEINSDQLLISYKPNSKMRHLPPEQVCAYTTTQGVIRTILKQKGIVFPQLIEPEDAPFRLYYDLLKEYGTEEMIKDIEPLLNTFFRV